MAKNEKAAVATTTAVKKEPDKKLSVGKRIAKWWREMKSELKKVVWPTPKQTMNNTLVALVVMVVAAIVIWAFDEAAQAIVRAIISLCT